MAPPLLERRLGEGLRWRGRWSARGTQTGSAWPEEGDHLIQFLGPRQEGHGLHYSVEEEAQGTGGGGGSRSGSEKGDGTIGGAGIRSGTEE